MERIAKGMRIAFIDHLQVGTGIIRYATRLAEAITKVDNSIQIDYYTHFSNYQKNRDLFDLASFKVICFKSTMPPSVIGKLKRRIWHLLEFPSSDDIANELGSLNGYDLFYLTSAHMSPYYEIRGPVCLTFHDFNWKYSFGMPNFSAESFQVLNNSFKKWLDKAEIITSSNFMRNELKKFYPEFNKKISVVYLPNIARKSGDKDVLEPLEFKYILYPANLASHKNHLNLFHALYLLKRDEKLKGYKLVLTGPGTDHFKFSKLSSEGIVYSDKSDFDVLGLGNVSNIEMDYLIKRSALNISASIYEAASGPLIDAWINKVPIIISDIPSHVDQLKFYNVECILFDPFDINDMVIKIQYALNNLSLLGAHSVEGHNALLEYNWEMAAKKYLEIFKSLYGTI